MKTAIAQLEISLETLVTNEPINRAKGNTEQADLEAVSASEIRQAITVLKAAQTLMESLIAAKTPPQHSVAKR